MHHLVAQQIQSINELIIEQSEKILRHDALMKEVNAIKVQNSQFKDQIENLSKEKVQIAKQYQDEISTSQKQLLDIQKKAQQFESRTKDQEEQFLKVKQQNEKFVHELQEANDKLN